MADEVTLAELINIISRIQVNYTALAKSWYDIFYNSTPIEKVDISYYDDSGNLQVDTIPNLAYARQYFTRGEGEPEGEVSAAIGTVYQDITNGDAYIKRSGEPTSTAGWVKFISASDLNKIIIQGSQNPEGRVTATVGTLFIDKDEDKGTLYMKRTSTGNTGWERIDSYPTSFVRYINDKVKSGTVQIKLPTEIAVVEDPNLINIFVDGTLLTPKRYRVWDDRRTIEFGSYQDDGRFKQVPLIVPESEEFMEVIVQYFLDVHLYENEKPQYLVEELSKCLNAVSAAETAAGEVSVAAKNLKIKIDNAVETAKQEAVDAITDAYRVEANKLTAISNKLENEISGISTAIRSEYRDIGKWYSEITQMQNSVAEMQRDVTEIRKDILKNSNYIHAKDLENDLMLKSVYNPEGFDTTFKKLDDKIMREDNLVRQDLTDALNEEAENRRLGDQNLETQISQVEETLADTAELIYNAINTLDARNTSEHNEIIGELNSVKDVYFYEGNMPIGLRSIYQYNKLINIDGMSTVNETGIIINLRRDCAYYTLDLGDLMATEDRNMTFDSLRFRLDPLDLNVSKYLDDPEDTRTNSNFFTNVMTQVRVMIKNESGFKPVIFWDLTNTTWLGGNEPDFEPYKNYLIEFISYDEGASWFSHVLGVCQPAIGVDDIKVLFELTLSDSSVTDGDFDIYYNDEDNDMVYGGTYTSADGKITFEKTIKPQNKGDIIKNLRVHKVNEDADFVKHILTVPSQEFTLLGDNTITATIDWSNTIVEEYSFDLHVDCSALKELVYDPTYRSPEDFNPALTGSQLEALIASGECTGFLINGTPANITELTSMEIEGVLHAAVAYEIPELGEQIESFEVLVQRDDVMLKMRNNHYENDDGDERYILCDVVAKITFTNDEEIELTSDYILNLDGNGYLPITLKNTVYPEIFTGVNEPNKTVENQIKCIKIKYDGLEENQCYMNLLLGEENTPVEDNITMSLDGVAEGILLDTLTEYEPTEPAAPGEEEEEGD